MKTYEEKELFDWMMAQPDDRPVNMTTNYFEDSCGCLLTQFFKSKGEVGSYSLICGELQDRNFKDVAIVNLSKESIVEWFGQKLFDVKFFGELKAEFIYL